MTDVLAFQLLFRGGWVNTSHGAAPSAGHGAAEQCFLYLMPFMAQQSIWQKVPDLFQIVHEM